MSSSTQPRRLYLFSNPRTMSNLFMRIFDGHPQLEQRDYFYFNAHLFGPEHQVSTPREAFTMMPGFDKWQEMTYQKALEECQGFIKSVEEQVNYLLFIGLLS